MFRFINTLNCLLTLADERSLSIERILINYRPIWNLVHSPLTRCRLETFGQIYHCFHLKLPDWFRYILTYRHIDRQVNKYCKKKKKKEKKGRRYANEFHSLTISIYFRIELVSDSCDSIDLIRLKGQLYLPIWKAYFHNSSVE